jgi:hypothetical protein
MLTTPSSVRRALSVFSGLLMLGTIVGAFFIMGSPKQQRLLRLDQQRSTQLTQIRSAIDTFYQTHQGTLPESLAQLKDPAVNGTMDFSYLITTDPETNIPFEYHQKGPLSFELCATFSTAVDEKQARSTGYYYDLFSRHPAGRFCMTVGEIPYSPPAK